MDEQLDCRIITSKLLMCAARFGLVYGQGKRTFLFRKWGGKPRLAHVVYKSSDYAFFMPDLVLILTWELSFGFGFQFVVFPNHSANLALCLDCVCCTPHPCPPLWCGVLTFHPFLWAKLHTTLQVHVWHSCSCGELFLTQSLVLV